MIEFLENIGDYFSQHFFDEDFPKKVFDKSGYGTDHIKEFTSKIAPLSEKYYKFKNDYLNLRRTKDKVKRTHDFHTQLLQALGYINGVRAYDEPVVMDDKKIIPVRYRFNKNDKPYLYIMEMQPMIQVGEVDADGLYEQSYIKDDWEKVLPDSWDGYDIRPEVIKEALSELFLLPEEERPVYLIMLAGPKIFLIQYEKWKFDSYLLFDLEELFTVTKTASNKNLLALFYALLAKKQFISETESVLVGLEEEAHKASYGVTVTIKSAVIYAVEALANEAIYYKSSQAKTLEAKKEIVKLLDNDNFSRELKDECLEMVYRLLFLFYAESRADLEILPIKDSTYQKGYSLEMLRDLEMVPLTTDSSRNGYFFSESLWKLFDFLHTGSDLKDVFQMRPLDSPLFDNASLKQLKGIQFRNKILQEIVVRLSLSERTKNKGRGRISYANLGINQLGSVYESLLSYSGFFAREDLIEVKNAKDKNGTDGTFLVPKTRRDDFKETEILKDPEHSEQDIIIPKGHFVYRLNGRDRKNSASYYTPEVLTQTTVKYTLKGIIERLKEKQAIVDGVLTGEACADEILKLKILEPAMGAAAFHNEVINQLAVAYLELKENEEQVAGRKRITPGDYKDELQKVKAYIAANNVYGVDLNPTAVELGKLSLWLNCMHKNMETPFFAHRLGAGNAVVGAWLKVYNDKDCLEEFPVLSNGKIGKKPIPKPWWDKAPKRVMWNKKGTLSRKRNQIYHFLLPDDNMVPSYGIKLLKNELTEVEQKAFKDWRSDFKKPLTRVELNRLQKISSVIDYLLEEHYKQQMGMVKDTASVYQVYGQPNPQTTTKAYNEKERLTDARKDRSAPYFKLKMVLDYWCSLWFWDVRDIRLLPNRTEWYNEVESILQIDTNELLADGTPQDIKEQIRKKTRAGTLFDTSDRIEKIEQLALQHRFFHNELEFIEVFYERGGFDVIVGNPPWVSVEMDEAGIIGEKYPQLAIRSFKAAEIRKIADDYLSKDYSLNLNYQQELLSTDSIKNFLRGKQNYRLLVGQRNNLYKNILCNSLIIANENSSVGLIHPEGIFEDPNAAELRKFIYPRLQFHFQFRNDLLLFSEVMNTRMYSVNIYRGKSTQIRFESISNLFTPSTIELINNNYNEDIYGFKVYNELENKWNWEVRGNNFRKIIFDSYLLNTLSRVYDESANNDGILPKVHDQGMSNVLAKLENLSKFIYDYNGYITDGFNEVNGIKSKLITKNIQEVKDESISILSGPHFFVNNPYYKNPYVDCKTPKHYDAIDFELQEKKFQQRTNFFTNSNYDEYLNKNTVWGLWEKQYKIIFSKMIDPGTERTLQCSIIPPNTIHTNSCLSFSIKDLERTVFICGILSSLIYDFYLKSSGKTNLYENTLSRFPIPRVPKAVRNLINLRTLRLNCVSENYKNLWEETFELSYLKDCFSKNIFGENNTSLNSEYSDKILLKNFWDRRLCQIEIDVLVAFVLGISLKDLISIYQVQFPTLIKNEYDTWYDEKGKIVFTVNSQGLKGIGVDSKIWNSIKDLKAGETYEHTITKSELYQGKTVTYHAPFTKCDRVEDYKTAWAHFESIFKTEEAVV